MIVPGCHVGSKLVNPLLNLCLRITCVIGLDDCPFGDDIDHVLGDRKGVILFVQSLD